MIKGTREGHKKDPAIIFLIFMCFFLSLSPSAQSSTEQSVLSDDQLHSSLTVLQAHGENVFIAVDHFLCENIYLYSCCKILSNMFTILQTGS